MKVQSLDSQSSLFQHKSSLIQAIVGASSIETTSIDGRPLLTPDQFGILLFKETLKPLTTAYNLSQSESKYRQLITSLGHDLHQNHTKNMRTTSGRQEVLSKKGIFEEFSKPYKKIKAADENQTESFIVKIESLDSDNRGRSNQNITHQVENLECEGYLLYRDDAEKNSSGKKEKASTERIVFRKF